VFRHLIFNVEHDHPKNPYRIHKELIEKASVDVVHNPHGTDIQSVEFNIDLDWIQRAPEFTDISYSYDRFLGLVERLSEKLKNSTEARETFATYFPDLTAIEELTSEVKQEFYRSLLDTDAAPIASSSNESAPVSSVIAYRLRKMLTIVEELDENIPTSSSSNDLTPGDRALIQMLHNIRTCHAGKITGVDHSYYAFAENKTYGEDELEDKGALTRIKQFINEELRRHRYLELSLNVAHDHLYLKNLIGREIGLFAQGEQPKLDINGNVASKRVRNLTKQAALDQFYKTYNTAQVIKWVQDLFNGDQIQIGEGADKWTVINQTLEDTKKNSPEGMVWDDRYTIFADEFNTIPKGVTQFGVAMILRKMGILTALGE
jgi:hypothetical protein